MAYLRDSKRLKRLAAARECIVLINKGKTVVEIAKLLGKSRRYLYQGMDELDALKRDDLLK